MATSKKLTFAEAKQLSIVDYLTASGFSPATIRSGDYWYYSPFREERTPSFKVNTKLNVWFDHGNGEGGSILDLGARLHHCSLVEFLGIFSQRHHYIQSTQQTNIYIKPAGALQIVSIDSLKNEDLLRYLTLRGISKSIADYFCKEIDFRVQDKTFKAIGFQNRSGAWELRNSWFKGSSSPKDISIIENGNDKLAVMEGFFDFLSLQQTDHAELKSIREGSDFLILNSLALLKHALPLFYSRRKVMLLLDNDRAAEDAKKSLLEKGVQFQDGSTLYSKHKDMNDFHIEKTDVHSVLRNNKKANGNRL